MHTLLLVVAVSIIVVAVIMLLSSLIGRLFRTKPARAASTGSKRTAAPARQWHAVRIAHGLICCEAATRLDERVFLADEAPRLPLDGCSKTDCRCRYVHLQDRRSGDDRRLDLGEFGAILPASRSDRRSGAGRRASDLVS